MQEFDILEKLQSEYRKHKIKTHAYVLRLSSELNSLKTKKLSKRERLRMKYYYKELRRIKSLIKF